MDKIVTANDIHWIVSKFLECSDVVQNRETLAGGFGIEPGVLAAIKRAVNLHDEGTYAYFSKVLSRWINNEADCATIGNLVLILKNEGFNKTACDIEREWNSQKKQSPISKKSKRNSEVWNIPARNLNFVGRSEILKWLEKYFSKETDHSVIGILCGLGGIGHSSVALEFAWRRRFNYKHVYWFNSEQRALLLEDYKTLALEINLISDSDVSKHKPDHLGRKLKRWLEQSENQGWLAIYNNAPNYEDIFDMLPVVGGHILLTSRFQIWYEGKAFSMDKFARSETSAYVRSILGPSTLSHDIDLLGTTFDHLPLALAQACAYIKHSSITIPKYLVMYNKNKAKWLARNALPRQLNTTSVFLTWEITFKKIGEESRIAANWLNILAVLNCDNVSHELLKTFLKWTNADEDEYTEVLMIPTSFSTIKINKEREFTSIHRLLQEVILLKIEQKERGRIILVAFLLIASQAHNFHRLSKMEVRWVPHWKALLHSANLLENQVISLSSIDLTPPNSEFTEIEVEPSFLQAILTALAGSENAKFTDAIDESHQKKLVDKLGLFFGKSSTVVTDCFESPENVSNSALETW